MPTPGDTILHRDFALASRLAAVIQTAEELTEKVKTVILAASLPAPPEQLYDMYLWSFECFDHSTLGGTGAMARSEHLPVEERRHRETRCVRCGTAWASILA